ncbi:MAG: AraC family transcriptional regulator [Lentisphaeria bacterium]
MSSRTLSWLFRREYGMGPMDLVIQKRINAATEMLAATDDIIEEIARKLNYKSVYSFSSLFKRRLGVRPGQFRQQCRAEKSKSHSK